MKKLITVLSIASGLVAGAQAGPVSVSSGKESKSIKETTAPVPVPEETCFNDREWQFDTFGQFSIGTGSNRAGVFREQGWGGGVGFNYFFSRHVGLGIDAAWLSAKENVAFARNDADSERTTIHNFSGSVIFRLPLDRSCLAPYAYVGGGFHVDGEQWASGHAGVGIEYRIKPNKFGIFLDGRYTYLGDRAEFDDLGFFSVRAGFRVIF